MASWPLVPCHPVSVSAFYSWAHFSSFPCCPLLSQGADPTGCVTQVPRSAEFCSDSANRRVGRRLEVAGNIIGSHWVLYGSNFSSMVAPWSLVPAPQEHHRHPLSLHPRTSIHSRFAYFWVVSPLFV